MILLVDNYDSFVYNLARYFKRLGQDVVVRRSDACSPRAVQELKPDVIVISPGPGAPRDAGYSLQLMRQFADSLPILGVCLGHQVIVEALGGSIVRGSEPVHGRTSLVYHDGEGVFGSLPNPLVVGRYHSLTADPQRMPDCLSVSATASDGSLMAVRHRARPIIGLQFHPESILTQHGYTMLARFLRIAGASVPADLPSLQSERLDEIGEIAVPAMSVPVTF